MQTRHLFSSFVFPSHGYSALSKYQIFSVLLENSSDVDMKYQKCMKHSDHGKLLLAGFGDSKHLQSWQYFDVPIQTFLKYEYNIDTR